MLALLTLAIPAVVSASSIIVPEFGAGGSFDEECSAGRYAMRGGSRSVYRGVYNQTADMDFSTIRVLISIAKGESSVREITLKLVGEYYFKEQMICLRDDTDDPYTLRIVNSGGYVTVYDYEGNEVISGESLELDRVYVSHTAGYATLHTDGYYSNPSAGIYGTDGNNYLGNFVFSIDSKGHLQMVNIVPMAHYVYGVITHEMSYNNRPESLKAQAVAAKCYGMCFMDNEPEYDVTDGYNRPVYQMYWGYCTDANRLTQFRYGLDVLGEALSYEGKIIPTYFAASNGGETTLPSMAFGPSEAKFNGAYDIRLDDVDFAYSYKRKTIEIDYGSEYQGYEYASRFYDFILFKARQETGINCTRVLSIDSMYAYDPVEGTQRNMQRVYVKANLLGESTVNDEGEPIEPEPFVYELRFIAEELKTLAIADIDGSGDVYNSSDPAVIKTSYRMFWGEPKANGYKLYVCRHGHGVGLSQHGAEAMARPQYGGKNYREILAFYYPNFDYITVKEDDPEAPLLSSLETAAYGSCIGEAVPLRAAPDPEADNALCMLRFGDHIDIISVTDDGCWYLVLANGHMGYVSYLAVGIEMFPSPADAVFTLYDGVCEGSAPLRTAPTEFSNRIMDIGSVPLTVWASIGDWYYVVTFKGDAGYVRANTVTIIEEYTVEGAEPIPNNAPEPNFIAAIGSEAVKPIGRKRTA